MSKPTNKKTLKKKTDIFVSYSHKDEDWKKKLEPTLQFLKEFKGITYWDDRQIKGGEDWYPNIKEVMKNAKIAICLISTNYLVSKFIKKEEIPHLLKKRETEGMLLIPILIKDCPWEEVRWLKKIQMFPRDGRCLANDYEGKEDRVFKEVFTSIKEYIEKVTKGSKKIVKKPISKWKRLAKKNIDIDRLPVTGAELFGRDKELKALDNFWESEPTNVVSFVAWGGVGKSTLINKWLQYMGEDNYRGAKKVFGWSFYSQGTNEKVTSADRFIREALEWFGDDKPDEGSAWDKGKRLGKLIGQEKNLLVLDGMEPLQSGLEVERGKIKDPALEMLLKQLAKKNEGLCIITTREEVPSMEKFGSAYQEVELDQISKEAGRSLLRVQGIRGTDTQIEKAVEKFGNHALAINLLGSYLHSIEGHRVSEANKIKSIRVKDKKSKHPRRVIKAWEERLGESAELNILRIMGLFDRPADEGAVNALRKKPVIKFLTDYIGRKDKFTKALKKLRDLNLISKESHIEHGDLDVHPIIRQHFADQLEKDYPETWIEANDRLYQFYKSFAEYQPDTLEGMQPLFFAVTHGCAAGKFQEAFDEVFLLRILRNSEFFINKKLGAYGAELAILSNFFEKKWSQPISKFSKRDKCLILNYTGLGLRALGSLRMAILPSKLALNIRVSMRSLKNASVNAGNLCDLHLTLGDKELAINYSRKGIEFDQRSESRKQKISSFGKFANILAQLGHLDEAEKHFIEAEEIQKYLIPEYPKLYSVLGFRYCEFLIEVKKNQEALGRAQYSIKISKEYDDLLSIALDTLILGRCCFFYELDHKKQKLKQTTEFLNEAVNGLRKAATLEFLPFGLLARAELYRVQRKWNEEQEDLDEVFDLSVSSGMRLHECDAHLEQARLFLAQGKKEEAKPHVEDARKLIEDTGYHRRDSALAELEGQVE
jgi:tetratricopeptide (TPR) repeat protein